MEIKDPIVWRIIGANVVAWIGAGIGAVVAPEFSFGGDDGVSSIVSALYVMVGAFLGALLGGGVGWLVDRDIGNHRRRVGDDSLDHLPDENQYQHDPPDEVSNQEDKL